MSCVICSFLMLVYPICNVLPGFDFLSRDFGLQSISLPAICRKADPWVNILAVKSDSTEGPHGYAKTAQVL